MAQEIFDKVKDILKDIENTTVQSKDELEQFRIKFLGTKNVVKPLFGEIKNI